MGDRRTSMRALAARSPRRPSTVTTSPSRRVVVAVRVPTTQGTPSSRPTMAAWQVIPPPSVTTAAARRIVGTQSGCVIGATSTSPGWRAWPSRGRAQDAHAPGGDARRSGQAAEQDRGRHRGRGRRRGGRRGQRRDRPGLHDRDVATADRPFDVLRDRRSAPRSPIAESSELDDLVVGEHARGGVLVVSSSVRRSDPRGRGRSGGSCARRGSTDEPGLRPSTRRRCRARPGRSRRLRRGRTRPR